MTPEDPMVRPCAPCGGHGRVASAAVPRPGGQPRARRCIACGGSGTVSADHRAIQELGAACRTIRREGGVALADMARRLGVLPWELARFEAGVERGLAAAQIVRGMAAIRRAAEMARRGGPGEPDALPDAAPDTTTIPPAGGSSPYPQQRDASPKRDPDAAGGRDLSGGA